MEISPVNWYAVIAGTFVFLSLLGFRLQYRGSRKEAHFLWASLGGLGAGAAIKFAYPIYHMLRYSSLAGVEDLWLYVYVGGLTVIALGVFAVYTAWETP
jgi:hypothetical protein